MGFLKPPSITPGTPPAAPPPAIQQQKPTQQKKPMAPTFLGAEATPAASGTFLGSPSLRAGKTMLGQ